MPTQFDPNNEIVKLCLKGIVLESNNDFDNAKKQFFEALDKSTNDFERYLASYFIAKNQNSEVEKLQWFIKTLELANHLDDIAVKSALPLIYDNISKCYLKLNDLDNSNKYAELSNTVEHSLDQGPFYHGTKASLAVGDSLVAGGLSNYQNDLTMNHIYFTALVNGAGLAAELAKGDGVGRIYIVVPTGDFENDPNVTNQKFPGNPTRSYRSKYPLKIIGEITDWKKRSDKEIAEWNEKVKKNSNKIIN